MKCKWCCYSCASGTTLNSEDYHGPCNSHTCVLPHVLLYSLHPLFAQSFVPSSSSTSSAVPQSSSSAGNVKHSSDKTSNAGTYSIINQQCRSADEIKSLSERSFLSSTQPTDLEQDEESVRYDSSFSESSGFSSLNQLARKKAHIAYSDDDHATSGHEDSQSQATWTAESESSVSHLRASRHRHSRGQVVTGEIINKLMEAWNIWISYFVTLSSQVSDIMLLPLRLF